MTNPLADLSCGDNSCMLGAPGGMATNGGCSCWDEAEHMIRMYQPTARKLAMLAGEAVPEAYTRQYFRRKIRAWADRMQAQAAELAALKDEA